MVYSAAALHTGGIRGGWLDSDVLGIASYELSVLFTPEREAAYLAHRHRGLRLDSLDGSAGPVLVARAGADAAAAGPASACCGDSSNPGGAPASAPGSHAAGKAPAVAACAVHFYAMDGTANSNCGGGGGPTVVDVLSDTGEPTQQQTVRVALPLPFRVPPRRFDPEVTGCWAGPGGFVSWRGVPDAPLNAAGTPLVS